MRKNPEWRMTAKGVRYPLRGSPDYDPSKAKGDKPRATAKGAPATKKAGRERALDFGALTANWSAPERNRLAEIIDFGPIPVPSPRVTVPGAITREKVSRLNERLAGAGRVEEYEHNGRRYFRFRGK